MFVIPADAGIQEIQIPFRPTGFLRRRECQIKRTL
jgi:hypothetical protein